MNIIIASLLPPGNSSGSEKFIKILYTELKTKKIDVYLANRQFENKIINYIIRLPGRILNRLFKKSIWLGWDLFYSTLLVGIKIFLIKMQKKGNIVIHAQDIFACYIALILKPLFNYRIILTVHFNESVAAEFIENKLIKRNGWLHKIIGCIEKNILQKTDHIVFVSDFMYQSLSEKYSMKNYSVIYNGTNNRNKITDKIFENGSNKILLNIGTLEKRKNQIFLLEMFSQLLEKNNEYELWLIGGGLDQKRLTEISERLNISSKIRFCGKVEEVNEYLSKTFLYLHSALIENFPLSLLEAQSCGIPVIAPPVGGIPELVKDGLNGYLLDTSKENIPKWINKIEELSKNKSLYHKLSDNSISNYKNNFTTDIMIKKYLEMYKSI